MPPLPTPFILSRASVPSRSATLTCSRSIWARWVKTSPARMGAITRPMHSSPVLYKKGGKQEVKRVVEQAKDSVKPNELAEDFTQMNKEIANAHSLMKDTLGKLRSGGKFNHELLEALRVQLGKDTKQAVKIGDIAQVVPRSGRQVVVMVGEQDHVKAVSSTIQGSPYSLNPTVNPHNPLELQIAIPPPTAESRKQVLAEADKAGEKTAHTIRQSRGTQQKKLNALEKEKVVRPDDMHKARGKMDKIIEEANKVTKDMLQRAKKVLEG